MLPSIKHRTYNQKNGAFLLKDDKKNLGTTWYLHHPDM